METIKKKIALLALLLLIMSLAGGCQEDNPECFQCKRYVYVNEEPLNDGEALGSNIYCDMDYKTAYHVEQANSFEYWDADDLVRIKVQCQRFNADAR